MKNGEGQARSSAGSGQRPKCIGLCIQDLLLCAAGCCVLFKKSLYCALPPLFRMLHSGHQQSRQLEQNNRLGVVWGGVGGSRVSSLDASKSRSETIKLTPDLHYSLWPDMVKMFLVLVGGAHKESSQKYQRIFQFNPFQMTIKLLKKRVPDKRFSVRLHRFW